MDYEKKYKDALGWIKDVYPTFEGALKEGAEHFFPELEESEDERIRKEIIRLLHKGGYMSPEDKEKAFAWLEKQGEQKEINLVEILKHYPRETELYSPLHGKLWLAEVDEEHEIITCYKHQLDEGCVRAILEQEDTVSFYSNGTTGLPDFSISKDCMLFLYDIEKQGEQKSQRMISAEAKEALYGKPAWSEEDEETLRRIRAIVRKDNSSRVEDILWLKSLKDRVQPQWRPSEEQLNALDGVYKTHGANGLCRRIIFNLLEQLKKL